MAQIAKINYYCYFCYLGGGDVVPDGVGGQAVHVHLHVGAHLLVRQELTGYHLDTAFPVTNTCTNP